MFESVLNLPRKFTDKKIPPNDAVWFNDNLMAGAHRLFCRSVGHPSSYQSVLTWQKSVSHIFESCSKMEQTDDCCPFSQMNGFSYVTGSLFQQDLLENLFLMCFTIN